MQISKFLHEQAHVRPTLTMYLDAFLSSYIMDIFLINSLLDHGEKLDFGQGCSGKIRGRFQGLWLV